MRVRRPRWRAARRAAAAAATAEAASAARETAAEAMAKAPLHTLDLGVSATRRTHLNSAASNMVAPRGLEGVLL
jgi:hypothetical protein